MRGRSPGGARALALMAALFAVTLNFLQPLAHAAAMREGTPGAIWQVFCNSAVADPESQGAVGSDAVPGGKLAVHDCCLGLAHAPALLAPAPDFVTLQPLMAESALLVPAEPRAAATIRDGPSRPRGPPFLT